MVATVSVTAVLVGAVLVGAVLVAEVSVAEVTVVVVLAAGTALHVTAESALERLLRRTTSTNQHVH